MQKIRNTEDGAIQELISYRYIAEEIKIVQERIQEMEQVMFSLKAIRYDTPKVQGGTGENAIDNAIDRWCELCEEEKRLKKQKQEKLDRINRKMEKLQTIEQAVLKLYYMEGMDTWNISCYMNYSRKQISRYMKSALEKYRKVA